ncbi:MAG TPA: RNA polymerase sigma factor [Polyangia bacterium]
MQLAAADVMSAFTALVRRHEAAVRRYASKFCGSPATGDDVAQETFVELWGTRRRYRPVGKFRVFLFTIVRNRCRNQYRGRQQQTELQTDLIEGLPAPTPNQLDEVLTAERQRQVDQEIAALSPKLREAVLLRFAEGLEYGEIASIVGCSEVTLRSRVFLGVSQIREGFKEERR